MSTAHTRSEQDHPELDDIIIYLFSKLSVEKDSDIKIPVSKVHKVLEPLAEELREDFDIYVKYHKSSVDVHSQQVEQALDDVYTVIRVSNPSFSLNFSKNISNMSVERATERFSEEDIRQLDSYLEQEDFSEVADEEVRTL